MNPHLILLGAYAAVLIALGAWAGRLVTGSRDYFVAGRRLPPFLLFATVLAANIGAGSTVGAASYGYRDGLGAWWWNGSAGLGSLVLAFWVGPRIWREAATHDYLTLGDFLEARYGRAVRGLAALLLWLGTLSILAGQLIGVASILHVVAGAPRWAGAVFGGVVTTLYFVAGGLLSSAWVNLVQLIVLLVGFAVAAPLALAAAGGLDGLASAPALPADYFGFWSSGQSGLTLLALFGPAFVVSPGLIQKTYGAVDERAIRIGIGASGGALMIFGILPAVIGMVARVLHPELASHDDALPTVLVRDLPPAIGSLALAAVFSAELSSADAVLFMLATSFSQDLYRRFVHPAATDRQLLRVARRAVVAGGTLGIVLAVLLPTVADALKIFYSLLTVLLFVPVVAALATDRAGWPEAAASMALGVTSMLAVHLWAGATGVGGWRADTIGLVVAALAFALVFTGRHAARSRPSP